MIYNTASDLQFDSTIRQQGKSTTYALIEDLIKAFELSNAIIIFFDFMILFYLVEHEHKARKTWIAKLMITNRRKRVKTPIHKRRDNSKYFLIGYKRVNP